jgi:hypothetical protein
VAPADLDEDVEDEDEDEGQSQNQDQNEDQEGEEVEEEPCIEESVVSTEEEEEEEEEGPTESSTQGQLLVPKLEVILSGMEGGGGNVVEMDRSLGQSGQGLTYHPEGVIISDPSSVMILQMEEGGTRKLYLIIPYLYLLLGRQ